MRDAGAKESLARKTTAPDEKFEIGKIKTDCASPHSPFFG
jgi:hypothetical protein